MNDAVSRDAWLMIQQNGGGVQGEEVRDIETTPHISPHFPPARIRGIPV